MKVRFYCLLALYYSLVNCHAFFLFSSFFIPLLIFHFAFHYNRRFILCYIWSQCILLCHYNWQFVNEMISVIFKLNNLRYIYINKEEKYYSRHISFSVEPSIHATSASDEIQLEKSCLYSFVPFFDMQSLHFFVFLFIFLFRRKID